MAMAIINSEALPASQRLSRIMACIIIVPYFGCKSNKNDSKRGNIRKLFFESLKKQAVSHQYHALELTVSMAETDSFMDQGDRCVPMIPSTKISL